MIEVLKAYGVPEYSLQIQNEQQAEGVARCMPDRAERRRLGRVLCGLMRPLREAPSASVSGRHCTRASAGRM